MIASFFQVIERHLFLMMVEFVLFLLIITWLLNRVQQPQVARAQSGTVTPSPQATSTSAAKQVAPIHQTKPPDKKKKSVHKVHQRRNSIDATPPRPKLTVVVAKPRSKDDMHLRLSGWFSVVFSYLSYFLVIRLYLDLNFCLHYIKWYDFQSL